MLRELKGDVEICVEDCAEEAGDDREALIECICACVRDAVAGYAKGPRGAGKR